MRQWRWWRLLLWAFHACCKVVDFLLYRVWGVMQFMQSVIAFNRSIAYGLRGLLRLARKGWYGPLFVISCREDRSIVVQTSAPRGSHHRNHHKLHTPVSFSRPTGRFKHGLARLAKQKTEHGHDSRRGIGLPPSWASQLQHMLNARHLFARTAYTVAARRQRRRFHHCHHRPSYNKAFRCKHPLTARSHA